MVKISPNTIYAIEGVTFVTLEPLHRAKRWRDLLAPGEGVFQSQIGYEVQIGTHLARWMTPGDYQAQYGLTWTAAPHEFGDLALLHLLAENIHTVKSIFELIGRRTDLISESGQMKLLVAPDLRDGFVFLIQEKPAEAWLSSRIAWTGEKLVLASV